MKPLFLRVLDGIRWTLSYYTLEEIKNHMFRYAGTERVIITPHSCDRHLDTTLFLQEDMEAEINQTIYTCKPQAITELFELLKDWLTDHRIIKVNESLILSIINDYNDETYDDFEKELQERIIKFQSKPEYKLKHLEEYEAPTNISYAKLSDGTKLYITNIEVNYKYYCIHEKPTYIDTAFLNQYLRVVDQVVSNCRNIITKYVKRYDEGKLILLSQTTPAQTLQILLSDKVEPTQSITTHLRRLKVKLDVPKLVYLFRLLYESDIFNTTTKEELYVFISTNFATVGKNEGDISVNKIRNLFSKDATDKDVAKFWNKIFKEMAVKSGAV